MLKSFTKTEILLWSISSGLIITAFLIFDRENFLNLAASLVGVTSLILCAKGRPTGMVLIIVFSVLYGIISFFSAYYGEMITYLGMTMPMSIISLVSWVKNPYSKNEVRVNRIRGREIGLALVLTAAITSGFFFILKYLGTANLIPSTFSVATSFFAVYLTFRRSPLFAAAYAINDAVLIVLWSLAAMNNVKYISVVVCFAAFLANDIYGFVNWRRMQRRQSSK
ncbi:MAG: nicotinamide riboside transporter PnuC [Oscillospiraceae bacterium]|nr:nicotinamide riboside transporter PnuC [Oscillospiraceae bacterium]